MREQQIASFRLDEHLFGINILLVREIIRNVEFTPVEHAAQGIRGMLNLRGQIITVLDLSHVLDLEERKLGPNSHCIILKTADELARLGDHGNFADDVGTEVVGIVVDDIADVLSIDDSQVEKPPANAKGINGENLAGVAKLDETLLLILNIRKVMAYWTERLDKGAGKSLQDVGA